MHPLDKPGLWAVTAPPPPATAPLSGAHGADVAVVGAGFTGLAAALAAAEAGARVIVLEAAEIGAGGSGRNVGLVNAGLWLMPDDLDRRLARHAQGSSLPALLGDAPAAVWSLIDRHSIDCEARPNGTLHCAPGRAGLAALRERARQWHARGAPVALLSADEARARTGSARFQGALFDPRAGTVQPLAYARGLAHAAIGAGARLHTDTPVTASTRDGGDWVLETPAGQVRAPRVIWATNAYSQAAADQPGRALSVLPFFNFATDPLPATLRAQLLPGGEGGWDSAKILTSFRLDAAGRFIIGSVGALGAADRHVHAAWAARRMAWLFPQLAGQRFVHAWFGRIGTTPDALPRLWQPGPGAFGLWGFNGRGIAPGTVLGQALARAALGQDARPPTLQAARPDRLRHARGAALRGGAALWHLADRRR
ncbi:MAG: Glycine/D-amino acid oxidases (deaminating) [Rhodobacteraceae bacterium HLUCCA12]|nr:MAG: Glycine/D-amino acid oxidases (deaminating) [Rhodobacteraceae bacterium HLUCCA12]